MTPLELRQWRERRNWTQEEAGMWYGLPVSSARRTWARWEGGERRIPRPLTWRIRAEEERKKAEAAR